MQKTLNINIYQDPTQHVEDFLEGWKQFGTYEQTLELNYTLIGRDNKISNLEMSLKQISISGEIPSESFMLIDALAKACESDKVIEGDVIDKNQTQQNPFGNVFGDQFGSGSSNAQFEIPFSMRQFTKITALSKAKIILLLIVALPLLLIMIPVMILFAIIKIIMFKLRF